MAHIRSCILALIAGLVCLASGAEHSRKFYPDDPIQADPKPAPIPKIERLEVNALYDYLYQTGRQKPRPPHPALGINTLGEVPDSAWFTNRHGRVRMTREALQRGAGNENQPQPPFVIVGAKTEGITPGFKMMDAKGRLYYVKPDPIDYPELSTGADILGSKFFYAIGYNTPENYTVRMKSSDWTIDNAAKIKAIGGIPREMVAKDLFDILAKVPLLPDGSFRVTASLAIPGTSLGPFRYEGTRSDDPNDIVPHEHRRDLRGLFVFCAWLNHTDAKAANSYDGLVQEGGVAFVRHYLIDFGSAFGSDGDAVKDARFGHKYQIPSAGDAFKSLFHLGLYSQAWERAEYPRARAVGRIESKIFDPERWKPNYPNPAFLNRRPDDEYWAAKIVMAFSDADIRSLVETGEYSDPRAADYVVNTLAERRDKIGRTYFAKVLPLDLFRIQNEKLVFEDLAARFNFRDAIEYRISWFKFNNTKGELSPLPGEDSPLLPRQFLSAGEGDYFAARIHAYADEKKCVLVYLRKNSTGAEVVGIERDW
jgi:hypothetical protein